MFLGHLESALEWSHSTLKMDYQPPFNTVGGMWKLRLSGQWIPPALDKPLSDAQAVAALLYLDTAVSNSPLRLSSLQLPTFDLEQKLSVDLDQLFIDVIGKTMPKSPIDIHIETHKHIFVVTIRAQEFTYGDEIVPRTDVGMRLHVALERTLRWYIPEQSNAQEAAA